MLGGQGGKDLYEKKSGHWVRTKGFDHWISENNKWKNERQPLWQKKISKKKTQLTMTAL